MAAQKVTFTFDLETIRQIDDAAKRLSRPKSQIVREAVADYHQRIGSLSESERRRMLRVFDAVVPRIPSRPAREVANELGALRNARRSGGRRSLRGTPK
jgi:hypothetical protein